MAAPGLHCYTRRAFSSCSEWGLLLLAVRRRLIAVASLVAEHGLQKSWLAGSQVMAHGLSCPEARGIFPE